MRIWVSRPEPGAMRTGARLAALGHHPLVAPVLAVAPTQGDPPAGPYAGLLLTSANALSGPPRWARFAAVPVFAVGARTGALARAAGFASVRVADGDAAALARLVRATLPVGAALLHAAGAQRKAEPHAALAAAGYPVTTFVAYAAAALGALPAGVAAAFDGDGGLPLRAALHYSRRSAAVARDLAVLAGRGGAFGALEHYCLSADVAAALAEAGLRVHFVPETPTEAGLLAGVGTGF